MNARSYYLLVRGERLGPLSREELTSAGLRWDSLVWFKGCSAWLAAREVPELVELFDEPPPVPTRPALEGSAYTAEGPGTPPRVAAPFRNAPPPAPQRLRYDDVSIRRTHRIFQSIYVTGLVLLILCGLLAYAAVLLDFSVTVIRFDPGAGRLVNERNGAIEVAETLTIIASVCTGTLGLPLLIAGLILGLVLLYRAWAVIQDRHVRATPGAAVGMLFVPFFNIYWVFVALRGLVVAQNRFAARYELDVPRSSSWLSVAVGVYFVLALIPYLGLPGIVLVLILVPFFVASFTRTTAFLCELKTREWIEETPPASEETVEYEMRRRAPAALAVTLTFIAMGLAPIALAMFVVGGLGGGAMALGHARANERLVAQRAALAAAPPVNRNAQPQGNQNVRDFEFARLSVNRSFEEMTIFLAIGGVGALLLIVTGGLCFLARTFDHRRETTDDDDTTGPLRAAVDTPGDRSVAADESPLVEGRGVPRL